MASNLVKASQQTQSIFKPSTISSKVTQQYQTPAKPTYQGPTQPNTDTRTFTSTGTTQGLQSSNLMSSTSNNQLANKQTVVNSNRNSGGSSLPVIAGPVSGGSSSGGSSSGNTSNQYFTPSNQSKYEPPKPDVAQAQSYYPGAVTEKKTGRVLMPGEGTSKTMYVRGEGAVSEDRTYQTLATRYAAEGLGDPRGLSTTKLAQALNRNIKEQQRGASQTQRAPGAEWDTHGGTTLEPPGYDMLVSSEQIALKQQYNREAESKFQESRPKPTTEQVLEVLKPISQQEFQSTGGVAPPGYSRGYPVTSSSRVNDMLSGYEDNERMMSVSLSPDQIVGQNVDGSYMISNYNNVATSKEVSSGDAFKPQVQSLSLGGALDGAIIQRTDGRFNYSDAATSSEVRSGDAFKQKSGFSNFVEDYKERVSGPLIPGAFAQSSESDTSISQPVIKKPATSQFNYKAPFATDSSTLFRDRTEQEIEQGKNLKQLGVEKFATSFGEKIRTGANTYQGNDIGSMTVRGAGKVLGFVSDVTLGGVGELSLTARKTAVGGSKATTTGEKIGAGITILSFIPVVKIAGATGRAIGVTTKAVRGAKGIEKVGAGYIAGKSELAEGLFLRPGYRVGRGYAAVREGYEAGRYGVKEAGNIAKERALAASKAVKSGYDSTLTGIKTGAGKVKSYALDKIRTGKTFAETNVLKNIGVGIGKTKAVAGRVYEKTLRPVAKALDKPTQIVESGVDLFTTSGTKTSNVLKATTRVVVNQAEIKGASALATSAGTKEEKEAFNRNSVTKKQALIIFNEAELSGYVPKGSGALGVLKTGLYYGGITADTKSGEAGLRKYLSEQGITGKDADLMVKSTIRSRNFNRVVAGASMLKAEHGGNVVGGRSVAADLKRRGITLTQQRAQDLLPRIGYGMRTRALGGATEGAISAYAAARTKPTYEMKGGLYQKDDIPENTEYAAKFLDFKVGGTTVSPLTLSARTDKTRYSVGTTGAVLVGAVSGTVFASLFGGAEEAIVGSKTLGSVAGKPSKVGRLAADVGGYGLDFPGEPLGDVYTGMVGPVQSRVRVKTGSFGFERAGPASSFTQQAKAGFSAGASNQALDSKGKGSQKGLGKGASLTDAQQRLGVKTYSETKEDTKKFQQEKQKQKEQLKQLQSETQQEKQLEKEQTQPMQKQDVFQNQKQQSFQNQQEKQTEKEQTTIFTPPFFPVPMGSMGGGQNTGRGTSYSKPRQQRYQADYQARVLGQYGSGGTKGTYTGAERRYLQPPKGQLFESVKPQSGEPFSPFATQSKPQSRTGSKTSKMMMNLNIGL